MKTFGSVWPFRDVGHQQAAMDVDLGRGEPDAFRGIHGLEHVVDQFTQWGVYGRHRDGPGTQSGVRILQDCEARHESGAPGRVYLAGDCC